MYHFQSRGIVWIFQRLLLRKAIQTLYELYSQTVSVPVPLLMSVPGLFWLSLIALSLRQSRLIASILASSSSVNGVRLILVAFSTSWNGQDAPTRTLVTS